MHRSTHPFVQPLEPRRFLSHAPGIDDVGVLGDSYGDEYRFYAPDRSTAHNWVEQLADDSNTSFGAFSLDPATPASNTTGRPAARRRAT